MNSNFTLLPTVLSLPACDGHNINIIHQPTLYFQDVANNENVDLNVGRSGVEAAAGKGKNGKKKKGANAHVANANVANANVAENGDVAAARRGKKSNGVAAGNEAAKLGKPANNDNGGNLEEIRKCHLLFQLQDVHFGR